MPNRLREAFGAEGTVLQRYATRLGCVEINSSFYRPHRPETYASWAAQVPATFRFAVKLPQAITHELRLRAATRLLDQFLAQVSGLGDRLGVLLVQLPASFAFDGRAVAPFFRALRARHAGPVTCEPRHRSWFTERAEATLAASSIGRVAADPACCEGAAHPIVAGDVAYWRMHGSPRMYWSPYGRERLAPLALDIAARARAGATAWCVFDNTASQAAAHDALELEALLAPARGSPVRAAK